MLYLHNIFHILYFFEKQYYKYWINTLLTGHSVSSHIVLTSTYTISTLEPGECHLADGWGPIK